MAVSGVDRDMIAGYNPPTSKVVAGWSSSVARQAHNLKVAGSNPAPATNYFNGLYVYFFFRVVLCQRFVNGST